MVTRSRGRPPSYPVPPLLSAVKEFHVTNNNKNNNIDDCMWSCGSWAWTAPHESYQNNLKAQSVDNTEKNWVCYSLSLISVVSFLSRIANSFLIYTHTQSAMPTFFALSTGATIDRVCKVASGMAQVVSPWLWLKISHIVRFWQMNP